MMLSCFRQLICVTLITILSTAIISCDDSGGQNQATNTGTGTTANSKQQVMLTVNVWPDRLNDDNTHHLKSVSVNDKVLLTEEASSTISHLKQMDLDALNKSVDQALTKAKEEDPTRPAQLVLNLDPEFDHGQLKTLLRSVIKLTNSMTFKMTDREDETFVFDFPVGRTGVKHKVEPVRQIDLPTVPAITRSVRSPTLKRPGNNEPSTLDVESTHGFGKPGDSPSTQASTADSASKEELKTDPPTDSEQPGRIYKSPPKLKTFIEVRSPGSFQPTYAIEGNTSFFSSMEGLISELQQLLGSNGYLEKDSPLILRVQNQVKMKQLLPLMKAIQDLGYEDIRISHGEPEG